MQDNKNKEGGEADEDVRLEATDAEEGEIHSLDKIKQLREKLNICEKERKEYLDGWQRAKADFINTRKEEEKTRGDFLKLAKGNFLSELFPILDSFEMAFANKEAWEKVDSGWRKGVEYIHSQLETVFATNGFKKIDPLGEPFDPAFHISIASVPVLGEEDDGKVVEVVQKGYSLEGRVARPAKVKIGEYKK